MLKAVTNKFVNHVLEGDLFLSTADFVSVAMAAQSERDDPDTWSLPSESVVKHGVATPREIGLEDATPREIQLDRVRTETEEIEADLLRGVSLRIALSGCGFSDVIFSLPFYASFSLNRVIFVFLLRICSEEGSTNNYQASIGNFHL